MRGSSNHPKDLVTKSSLQKKNNKTISRTFSYKFKKFFESYVEIPRIKAGKKQAVETLINEEALLLAKFIRDERETWTPRNGIKDYIKSQKLAS